MSTTKATTHHMSKTTAYISYAVITIVLAAIGAFIGKELEKKKRNGNGKGTYVAVGTILGALVGVGISAALYERYFKKKTTKK